MSNFNQGIPGPATLINSSSTLLYGNAASANALSVQQLGTGPVFRFSNAAGLSNVMVMDANGRVGVGTANPATALDVFTGTMNAATVVATTYYGAIAGSNTVSASTLTGAGSGITSLNMGNAGSGTLAVARGGTGVTSSTGTGSVVLSAGPTLSGTVTGGTFSGTHTGDGSGVTSLNMGNAGSGTLAVARGGTGVTSSTGTGSVVLSASPALSGTATFASITTSGNVGIGTASPSGKLTVATSGGGTAAAGGWDANWSVVHGTTVGGAAGGVGIAFNDGNFGVLSCVAPSIAWRTMLYAAGRHDFYINGFFALAMYNIMTGGATTISVDAAGGLQRGAVSDQRLKSNIVTMSEFGLKTITDLRPVTYEATPESLNRIGAGVHIGLVAQEVQTIFPYAVSADQDEQKTLTIDYIKLVPVMINAFKELSIENNALKTQLTAVDARLAALEAKLNSQ